MTRFLFWSSFVGNHGLIAFGSSVYGQTEAEENSHENWLSASK